MIVVISRGSGRATPQRTNPPQPLDRPNQPPQKRHTQPNKTTTTTPYRTHARHDSRMPRTDDGVRAHEADVLVLQPELRAALRIRLDVAFFSGGGSRGGRGGCTCVRLRQREKRGAMGQRQCHKPHKKNNTQDNSYTKQTGKNATHRGRRPCARRRPARRAPCRRG